MKITKEDLERIEQGSPIELFYQGIKAKATRDSYERTLKLVTLNILSGVLEGDTLEARVRYLVDETRKNPRWATNIFLLLSENLRKRTELDPKDSQYLSPATVTKYFKPFKKLFAMSDVPFSWARVNATFPELSNKTKTRGYTKKELQIMLHFANGALDRLIITASASSGMRLGGLVLKWSDIQPVYVVNNRITLDILESEQAHAEIVCAAVLVYQGSKEEYAGFITPEAYQALLDYRIQWTKEIGREPKPHDPIFKHEGSKLVALKSTAIKQRVDRILVKSGLRIKVPGTRRYEVPTMNGFRRFWNKTVKETIPKGSALDSLIKKEYMMGHSGLIKMDKHYFHTHMTELVEEYLEAVPYLTISDDIQMKNENDTLRKENQGYSKRVNEIDDLKATQQILLDLVFRSENAVPLDSQEKEKYKKVLETLGFQIN